MLYTHPDRISDFKEAMLFIVDAVVDAPKFARAADVVDFVLDMMAEESLSDESYDALCSKEGRAALVAYAEFITVAGLSAHLEIADGPTPCPECGAVTWDGHHADCDYNATSIVTNGAP